MIEQIKTRFHIRGIHRAINLWLVNHLYAGDSKVKYFEKKRKLLIAIGFDIGEGTKIVGPIYPHGKIIIGKNCWIGKNLTVNGNGCVTIEDSCDIGPEVAFQTGGHEIGTRDRRAGEECIFNQLIGAGSWIGGRATVLNNTNIGKSCVVAGCACVIKDVPDNSVVGGVPARIIKSLD